MLVKPALLLLRADSTFSGLDYTLPPLLATPLPAQPLGWRPSLTSLFLSQSNSHPSYVLCDIAGMAENQTPISWGFSVLCVSSISFLVSRSAAAQTPLAAPDLQAVPGSSFISPICSPQPPSSILPASCQAVRLTISAAPRGDQVCRGWGLAPPWSPGETEQLLFPSLTWQPEPHLSNRSREMHNWERGIRTCLDSGQPEAQGALLGWA